MKGQQNRRAEKTTKIPDAAVTPSPARRWIDRLGPRWSGVIAISIVALSVLGALGHFLGGVAGLWEFSQSSVLGHLLKTNPPASATHTDSPAPSLSIAILPFTSSLSDGDSQFVDALTQDVTTSIAGWRWATVAAYGSAAGYKDKPFDARSVGQELSVRYLLASEVRTAGESMQVTARLIDAKTGTQVWTDRLEFAARSAPDTPPVPHLLLAKRLRSGLLGVEMRRVTAHPTSDSLMESTLRGLAAEDDAVDTMKGILAARELYGKVLQRDPNFVPAMWRYVATLNGEWVENPSPDRDQLAKEMD